MSVHYQVWKMELTGKYGILARETAGQGVIVSPVFSRGAATYLVNYLNAVQTPLNEFWRLFGA